VENRQTTTMANWLGEVSRFCRDVVLLKAPDDGPVVLSPQRAQFYAGTVREELAEFLAATEDGSVSDAADAVVDLIYFSLGRLYEMGVPAEVVFGDVHRANMEKVRGMKKREVRDEDDAVKPEGWEPPDHSWLAHLSYVAVEAARLRAGKTADYDGDGIEKGDYFPFRELSHAQMIWTKALRVRSLAKRAYDSRVRGEVGVEPNYEALRDSLTDIINYSTYAVEDLDGELSRGDGS
jgi:predicted HAD superfamily Cof-like phosphohydrolase